MKRLNYLRVYKYTTKEESKYSLYYTLSLLSESSISF